MKRKGIVTLLLLFLVSIIATICSACNLTAGSAVLSLDKTSIELYVNGSTGVIRASLDPADKDARYEWTVEDEKIATIAPSQSVCRVTPVAEGTTTVTVSVGELAASCTVKVGADQHVQLEAPSFTYDDETGVITISDTNNAENVGGYLLYFYDADGEEAGSVEIASGDIVDTRRIEKGTYTIRLVAYGADELYLDSEPSTSEATVEVTVDPLYDLGVGDAGATEKSDNWAYYKYDWVTVSEAYFYDGEATLSFSNNASESTAYNWILQLIYNYGQGEEGKTYKMQLKIVSPCEGRVTLGDKPVTLHEGENICTVGFTGTNLFKIQFGVYGEINTIKEGTVTVSIVTPVEETEITPLAVPNSFSYNQDANTISINDTVNSEYDVNYTLGFFTSATATTPQGTTKVVNGGEVDNTSVGSGTYYLRLMAASAGLPYSASAWSDVNGTITIVNDKVDIANAGQATAAANPNSWREWHATTAQNSGAQTVVEYAYLDAEGVIYVSYEVTSGSTYQPLKLFYMDSAIEEGQEYTLSFKLVSAMAGKITVNSQIVEVVEGENIISVTRAQPNKTNGTDRCTITIQFGARETVDGETVDTMLQGVFTISNIEITPVVTEEDPA